MELEGVTGHVAFDEHGNRRDFTLSVNELNLNTEARPVSCLIIIVIITAIILIIAHLVNIYYK